MNDRDRPSKFDLEIMGPGTKEQSLSLFEIGFYDPEGKYHLVTRKGTWVECDAFRALKLYGAIADGYSLAIFYHG